LDPDPGAHAGRPQVLSKEDIDHLVATTKRDWGSRHMTLIELQLEAGLGRVSKSTVYKALKSRGIKAYVDEKKFILNEDNKKRRVVSEELPVVHTQDTGTPYWTWTYTCQTNSEASTM
jgi:hypothetical protein